MTIKNKGTGAGGSNTNKNGLNYEELTDLSDSYNIIDKDNYANTIKFKGSNKLYQCTRKKNFQKYFNDKIDKTVNELHGTKQPDEVFINETDKTIFILEKKFQQVGGSKCECLQTASNKLRNYKRRIPSYKIVYVYCLSDWFKINCKAELEDLNEDKIPVFWGNSQTYKQDIINFIINY